MARVTVEDCILVVQNRFELVHLAAKRAREILAGSPLTVARDNDKNAVVSLREISENSINIDHLREKLIKSMQRNVFIDDQDSDPSQEVTDGLEEADEVNVFENTMIENDLLSTDTLSVSDDFDDALNNSLDVADEQL